MRSLDALPIRNTLAGAGAHGSAATFSTYRPIFGGARHALGAPPRSVDRQSARRVSGERGARATYQMQNVSKRTAHASKDWRQA
jgi:hypothetical protein